MRRVGCWYEVFITPRAYVGGTSYCAMARILGTVLRITLWLGLEMILKKTDVELEVLDAKAWQGCGYRCVFDRVSG